MLWWWSVAILGVPVGLLALDRLLLSAESRGWIFYRRNRPPPGTARTGALTVMSIYQPGHEHIVSERFRIAAKVEEADDDEPLAFLPPLTGAREPRDVE